MTIAAVPPVQDERPVEDLIADLQLARAGLNPADAASLNSRSRDLQDAARRLGVSGLVEELLADEKTPDVSAHFMDLEADETGRQRSYARWRAAARERLPELWAWIRQRQTGDEGVAWWRRSAGLQPPEQTLELLGRITARVRPVRHIAERWALQAGLSEGTREHNWRWLALGRGLQVPVPPLDHLLPKVSGRFRQLGFLPPEHRIQLIRRPNTPSMVLPVRVPGRSILSLPAATSPLTIQYLQHELAHLAEQALRPPTASLADRWRFDPVRSEGFAFLFESTAHDPEWLEQFDFERADAAAISGFYREEEEFTLGLMAADIAMDAALSTFSNVREALECAERLSHGLGIDWAPELMLFRLPRAMQWRAYIAARRWRDKAASALSGRFGSGWKREPEAWRLLQEVFGTVGSSVDALERLSGMGPHD